MQSKADVASLDNEYVKPEADADPTPPARLVIGSDALPLLHFVIFVIFAFFRFRASLR